MSSADDRFPSDTAFRAAVDATLSALLEQIDVLEADIDAGLMPGNLNVLFEDDRSTFVLSQQTPTHELWLSANLRAWHFRWRGAAWSERDTGEDMLALLSRLFAQKVGQPVHFVAPGA
jgi:iron donor protein CyaY